MHCTIAYRFCRLWHRIQALPRRWTSFLLNSYLTLSFCTLFCGHWAHRGSARLGQVGGLTVTRLRSRLRGLASSFKVSGDRTSVTSTSGERYQASYWSMEEFREESNNVKLHFVLLASFVISLVIMLDSVQRSATFCQLSS